jgi:sugar-phosphatase
VTQPFELVVDGVLFDMDGTLVDSTVVVEQMWTEFAVAHGVHPPEVIDFAHGRPSRDTITRYAPHAFDEWNQRFIDGEHTRFSEVVEVPGAAVFVNSLPRGSWALVTSALHMPARDRLRVIGIEPPDVVVAAEDVVQGKPHPEGYLAAAAGLGLDPARCVVFEDTDAGLTAGLAAGCSVVAVGEKPGAGLELAGRIADFTSVTAKVTPHGIAISGP